MLKQEQLSLTALAVRYTLCLWIALQSGLSCLYGQSLENVYDSSDRSIPSIPRVGIKTNLLYDATTTFNLGVEFRTGHKTSLDISGNWNPWTFGNNRKWKHVLVQPEFRLWTKETFAGHFFGFHAHYAFYNVGNLPGWLFSQNMQESRYEGWLAGAGVGYGYRWNFSRHWATEAEIGVGYAYMDYDKYECGNCGTKLGSHTKHYFGPTKAAVSLIYSFGGKKTEAKSVPAPTYTPPVIAVEEQPVPQMPVAPIYAVAYLTPEAEPVKHRSESGKAYLDFASGKSEIIPTFKNNAVELDRIHRLIEKVKNDPDVTITRIAITGYASPEGTYQSNLAISQKRAAALQKHVQSIYGFPNSFFVVEGKGEDWQELDTLVSHSVMADKYRILEIIRGTDIFDGREKKLMNLAGGAPYREMLTKLFPQLRRSEYTLHYTVAPLTIERAKEVFKTNPSSLSLNEMFLIANTHEQGSAEFNDVFETAARIFPQNDTANLNAAASALARKDTTTAERYLNKVSEQGSHSATYHNNAGVLHSQQEEYDKAASNFERGKTLGDGQAARNLTLLAKYKEEAATYEQAIKRTENP